jgi:hypothetical protein
MDKEYKPLVDEALVQLKLITKSTILAPEIREQAKEIVSILTGKAKQKTKGISVEQYIEDEFFGTDMETAGLASHTWTATQPVAISGTEMPSGTELRGQQIAQRFSLPVTLNDSVSITDISTAIPF